MGRSPLSRLVGRKRVDVEAAVGTQLYQHDHGRLGQVEVSWVES
jgi:hypothetical protein